MATAIEQAKQAEVPHLAAPVVAPTVPAAMRQPLPTDALNHANQNQHKPIAPDTPGYNPEDFVRDNRIHEKYGSLFIDPYLVIHPHELAEENEPALRKKLQLTYSINNPSFYESPERTAIALNLGQLVPPTLKAERSKLMDEVKKFNTQVDTGVNAALKQQIDDHRHPFAAVLRDTVENPQADPVGIETLKNGLAIYLLCREKLTQQGYLNKLTDYVLRTGTSQQVLSDLSDKLGVDPRAMTEAAFSGGVDGVGKLLGLDPKYVADVKALTEHAATQDFGYNLVEHWHLGRQLLGLDAPLQQKITTGMDARITAKIADYRNRVHHHYEVPIPIEKDEHRIAQAMELLEPIQRVLMHRYGYEICYSPDQTADDIAFHKGVNGLHRKAANDLRDVNGTYRIYFAGKGDLKNSLRTFMHECAHLFMPEKFSPQQMQEMDQLATHDQVRFRQWQMVMGEPEYFRSFETLLNTYHAAANDAERAAVIATANDKLAELAAKNKWPAPQELKVDGLFPHLKEAHKFQFMVKHANDRLSVEGMMYPQSGYNTPQEIIREVISRFAELHQVEHKDERELLGCLAPGLTKVWDQYYIPHLERAYAELKPNEGVQVTSAGPMKLADNVVPMAVAANDADPVPQVQEQPKVREEVKAAPAPVTHAGTPVVAAPTAQASTIDAAPANTVDAGSIVHTAQTLSAMSALQSMGIRS